MHTDRSDRSLPRVYLVVGTRPEAIKMAPVVLAMRRDALVEPVLVATGQHPDMVHQALEPFGLTPDVALRLCRKSGGQAELAAQLCGRLDEEFADRPSGAVVVQGDTTSALIGGLVAFWRRLRLVHLEAGLRSGDLTAPFPEEMNRRLLAVLADLHLAPTRRAVDALAGERVPPDRVLLVGNTVVDAALHVSARRQRLDDPRLREIEHEVEAGRARLILVTAHRRESWGAPLDRILAGVDAVVRARPDVRCVLPAHPNPSVRGQVVRALRHTPRTVVTEPLAYPVLCQLLARSALVLSDSGGIQEEAPSFGVPVLVLREVTERVEAVQAGWSTLVGSDVGVLVSAALSALDGPPVRGRPGNPFGDGLAGARSAQAVAALLGRAAPPAPFRPPGDDLVGIEPVWSGPQARTMTSVGG